MSNALPHHRQVNAVRMIAPRSERSSDALAHTGHNFRWDAVWSNCFNEIASSMSPAKVAGQLPTTFQLNLFVTCGYPLTRPPPKAPASWVRSVIYPGRRSLYIACELITGYRWKVM